jgi:transposase
VAFSHRGGDRSQRFLLPPSLDDWLSQDHLARFLAGAVDQLDLRAFARPKRADGRGRRSYDPKMLLTLVLLAWCDGERSSRRIERACRENIAYRWVSGNEAPDHTTISRFIKDQAGALDGLFAQVLRLALAAGMGNLGVVSIDGTKIGADASPQKTWSRDRLETEVRRIRDEHQANDADDDERYGDSRGDELPGDLADPDRRDARIQEALRQMEAEDAAAQADYEAREAERVASRRPGRPPNPPTPTDRKANITDPDCRFMRVPSGFRLGYNAQAAVSQDQLIVAADVTQDRNDTAQLQPMMGAVLDNLDEAAAPRPDAIAADTGYWNSDIDIDLEDPDAPELLVPPVPSPKRKKLATRGPVPKDATAEQRMERKLATKAGSARYRHRAITTEPVFGQIKASRGITRFRRRGLDAAKSEWFLIATTSNLLKMWRAEISFA